MNAQTVAGDDTLIDARGLMCPEPVVLARRALLTLPAGACISVLVTDPLAPLDLQVLCTRTGARLLSDEAETGEVRRVRIAR